MENDIVQSLKDEIAYLRSVLDENDIEYDFELYQRERKKETKTPDKVDILPLEITKETAKFFFSMFHGRVDVYARRSRDKGYFPQCDNFWKVNICPKRDRTKTKCSECASRAYSVLNTEVIMHHMAGEREDCTDVLGLYVMQKNSTCRFIVFDFDNHDENTEAKGWQEEVNALRQICKFFGIDCLVERSRSGKGAHLWIFFNEPVPADKARKFGNTLITKGAEHVSLKSFRYYDRMLPMQDTLPEGGLGNLIALPWQGKALKNGNSVFVDERFTPYRDQMEVLKRIRKISSSDLESYLNEWSTEEMDLRSLQKGSYNPDNSDSTGNVRKSFHSSDVAGAVSITLRDGIYVDTRHLKPRIQNAIRRLAAYSNPEFYRKLRQGFPTHEIPRIVYCGYDNGDCIVLPRGCKKSLLSAFDEAGIKYNTTDKRQQGRSIDVSFNGQLYPEQMSAANIMLSADNGILSAATAFGKTVVGSYLIAQRKVSTLILVHNVEIMNVWEKDLSHFLIINEDFPTYTTPRGKIKHRNTLIGTFSSKRNNLTGIIDVVMVSSLGKDDEINPLVKDYGMVIMDECHHGAAYGSESVLRAITARYVYGLTATPKRDDGQERKVFMQFGPVLHKYTAKERVRKQGIGHYVYPRFTRLVDAREKLSISEAMSLVSESELRNLQIASDVRECIRQGRTPIVMTKRKDHAKRLYEMLKDEARHCFLLQGGGGLNERERLRQMMESVPKEESLIAVAIGQYIGEGFNYPRLDTLLLAMPISFENNVEQYAGRLNRDYEGKKDVLIFDYIDQYIPMLERMYHKRLRTYKRIGFEICSNLADKQNVTDSIYDSKNYKDVYDRDIISAHSRIVISSPGLSTSKVSDFIRTTTTLLQNGIHIKVYTLSPKAYPTDARENQHQMIAKLQQIGISVKESENCRDHFAIIDDSIIWYGSMNLLSREKEDDNLMRIQSTQIAQELLIKSTTIPNEAKGA